MFRQVIAEVDAADFACGKNIPNGVDYFEVAVNRDLSYITWLSYSDCDVPVAGFRIVNVKDCRFDLLHILEDTDYIMYLAHIANLVGMRQNRQVYISLSCSETVNFFKCNTELLNRLLHTFVFLQRSYSYVEFLIENVIPLQQIGNECIYAENGGAPVFPVVELFNDSGGYPLRNCTNIYNMQQTLSGITYLSQYVTTDDYINNDRCTVVRLGTNKPTYVKAGFDILQENKFTGSVVIPNSSKVLNVLARYNK